RPIRDDEGHQSINPDHGKQQGQCSETSIEGKLKAIEGCGFFYDLSHRARPGHWHLWIEFLYCCGYRAPELLRISSTLDSEHVEWVNELTQRRDHFWPDRPAKLLSVLNVLVYSNDAQFKERLPRQGRELQFLVQRIESAQILLHEGLINHDDGH